MIGAHGPRSRPTVVLAAALALALGAGLPSLAVAHARPPAHLSSIDFVTSRLAFALANLSGRTPSSSPELLRSRDGGRTWQVVRERLVADRACPSVSALAMTSDGEHGLLVRNDGPAAGSLPVCLWRTADGGRAWRETGTTVLSSGALAVSGLGRWVVALSGSGAAPTASVRVLLPAERTLADLTDRHDPEGPAGYVSAVSLLAIGKGQAVASVAYVWGKAALFTYSASSPYRTWRPRRIALPSDTTTVAAVAFSSSVSGVALLSEGGHSVLAWTADAGRTWRRAQPPIPMSVDQLEAIGPDAYAILGGGGALWLSTDDGLEWVRQGPRNVS